MKNKKSLAVLLALALALAYASVSFAGVGTPMTALFGTPSAAQESAPISALAQPQKITSALSADVGALAPDENIVVLIEASDSAGKFGISGAAVPDANSAAKEIAARKPKLDRVENYAKSVGASVRGKYPVGKIVSVEIPKKKLDELTKSGDVKAIWPNSKVYPALDVSVPNTGAPDLWAKGLDGTGVKIAILDTGIDKTHPMLTGKVIAEAYFSGTDIAPCASHGTHVAGIAAGTKANGGSYNGVAPGALIMNAKVLGDTTSCYGSMESVIAGINWAVDPDGNPLTDDGADVISMSLGAPYSDPFSPQSMAIKDAVNLGVTVTVAAGNCGLPCPSSTCGNYRGVTVPGDSPYAITVGAVDDSNSRACFSSGGNISGVGIKPDVSAPGVAILSSVPGGYVAMSGTSMATPHVAGAAALLIQANPGIKPAEIKALLEYTAKDLGLPGKDVEYGAGAINLTGITDARMLAIPASITDSVLISRPFVRNISLFNYGAKAIRISNITTDGRTIINTTGPFDIAPMETKSIRVEVKPALIGIGTFNGYVRIISNSTTPDISIPITLGIFQSEEPVIYSVQMQALFFRKDVVALSVNATDNKGLTAITAYITDPRNSIATVPLQADADGLWKATFLSGNNTGTYGVKIDASDGDGFNTTYEAQYDVVGVLLSVPEEIVIGRDANFSARYKNINDTPSEYYIVYALTDWLDSIEKTGMAGPNDIIPEGVTTFNWTWVPQKTGEYVLRMYVYENESVLEFIERNVTSLVKDIADITGTAVSPASAIKGNNLTFSATARNNDSSTINGTMEFDVLDISQNFVSVLLSETKEMAALSETSFSVEVPALLPGENYTLLSRLHYGNRVEEKRAPFEIVTPPNGRVAAIRIPPTGVQEKTGIEVTFENMGNVQVGAEVKGDIAEGDVQTDYISFGTSGVNASGTKTFSANWTAPEKAGNYTLHTIASYEGNTIENFTLFEVKDLSPPNITSLNFKAPKITGEPLTINARVFDHSAIRSATLNVTAPGAVKYSVPLELKWGDVLTGTFSETSAGGQYFFSIESCDTYGNCASAEPNAFSPAACSGKKILVVNTHYGPEAEPFSSALNNTYCVSLWNKADAGSPAKEHLGKFDAVVWSTGSTSGNSLTGNDTAMLKEYMSAGGRLLIEGDDVLFMFGRSLENVTGAHLLNDLLYTASAINLSGKTPNKTILITQDHPITRGLPKALEFNTSYSRYPDALVPFGGGASLAGWSDGGSAITITSDLAGTGAMSAYIPFAAGAIGSESATPIRNIAGWLLTDRNSPNFKVQSIDVPAPVVEDVLTDYNIIISNTGTEPAATTAFVSVDGAENGSFGISLGAGETKSVARQLALGLGAHNISVSLNRDFLLEEQDYLDNTLEENITVISKKPDIAVTSVESLEEPVAGKIIPIAATLKNLGGGAANGVGVGIYVDGERIALERVSLGPFGGTNSEARVTAEWRAKEGVHTARVAADEGGALDEANETNNELASQIYGCNVLRVAVVYDDDTNMSSTEGRDTTGAIADILRNNSYCTTVWKESEKGIPGADYLNAFDAVIWASGNNWGKAAGAEDERVLRNLTTSVIFEGADIAFDHDGDNFSGEVLGAAFQKDIIQSVERYVVNFSEGNALTNITSAELDSSTGPYPDAVLPFGNTSASFAQWNSTNTSAATAHEAGGRKVVFFTFTLDSINDSATKERLVLDAVRWAGPETQGFERQLKAGWNLVSIPRQYLADDIDTVLGSIAGNYTVVFAWNASKSGGASNWITYSPKRPAFMNELKKIDRTMGFWIYMAKDSTLKLTGKVRGMTNITLYGTGKSPDIEGWNLVGYTPDSNAPPESVLSRILGNLTVLYGNFEPPNHWESYVPGWEGYGMREMKPGYGYWIMLNTNESALLEYA